jgi:hypothetical protein
MAAFMRLHLRDPVTYVSGRGIGCGQRTLDFSTDSETELSEGIAALAARLLLKRAARSPDRRLNA